MLKFRCLLHDTASKFGLNLQPVAPAKSAVKNTDDTSDQNEIVSAAPSASGPQSRKQAGATE